MPAAFLRTACLFAPEWIPAGEPPPLAFAKPQTAAGPYPRSAHLKLKRGGCLRTAGRDLLLLLLAAGAGAADAWSYTGLGHAFVANMTGNTVLLGLAVCKVHGDVLHPLISLACYAAGTAVAARLTRDAGKDAIWTRSVSLTLFLEASILVAAEIGRAIFFLRAPLWPRATDFLLGCVAFAVGLQSGSMLQLKIPGIVTTYITGTWTNLVSGIVKFFARQKEENPSERERFEERLLLQTGILVVYFLSAVLTGWLFRFYPAFSGVVAAGCVLLAALAGVIQG